mgnify:FL=1|jgi:hypothetical protein
MSSVIKTWNYEVSIQFKEIFDNVEKAAMQKSPGSEANVKVLSSRPVRSNIKLKESYDKSKVDSKVGTAE